MFKEYPALHAKWVFLCPFGELQSRQLFPLRENTFYASGKHQAFKD